MAIPVARKVNVVKMLAHWKNSLAAGLNWRRSCLGWSFLRLVMGRGFPPGPLASGTTTSSLFALYMEKEAPTTMKTKIKRSGYRYCAMLRTRSAGVSCGLVTAFVILQLDPPS